MESFFPIVSDPSLTHTLLYFTLLPGFFRSKVYPTWDIHMFIQRYIYICGKKNSCPYCFQLNVTPHFYLTFHTLRRSKFFSLSLISPFPSSSLFLSVYQCNWLLISLFFSFLISPFFIRQSSSKSDACEILFFSISHLSFGSPLPITVHLCCCFTHLNDNDNEINPNSNKCLWTVY